ncbi:C-3 sterol dehydrogenase/C-4 decarboxylase [Periconia macrospinosa]|uniref:C-3 sterol dehydrogenase/C-4 decarboxylase n=1 Tax=Periconia macrospinosa TaxID=97972 RepID=A0A2V1EF49_9PLEO|nr:C-3 sterol dehydrogenase/C-4 decarboxylase [Periconia macrospinosa]
MDPVLVIGGCGGLGHHIVKQLLEEGHATNITVFDKNTSRNRIEKINYITGDLGSSEDVHNAFRNTKPRVVFHTASPMLMGQKNSPDLFEKINITGTQTMLEAIRAVQSVHALIYTGTSSVVHNNLTDIVNATEDWPKCYLPEQTEYYTHTKAVAEDMILAANRKDNLLTVTIRGSTLFGEGDSTTIPQLVGNALSGRSNMQVGDNKNLFDYTYLGNAAHAHILAASILLKTSPSSPPPPADQRVDGEAFVVTNDSPWPFWNFGRAVSAAVGRPISPKDIRVVPSWLFYIFAVFAEWGVWMVSLGQRESHLNRKMVRYFSMTRTFDITKAKERLGYRPRIGTEDAIKKSVEHFLATREEEGKKEL